MATQFPGDTKIHRVVAIAADMPASQLPAGRCASGVAAGPHRIDYPLRTIRNMKPPPCAFEQIANAAFSACEWAVLLFVVVPILLHEVLIRDDTRCRHDRGRSRGGGLRGHTGLRSLAHDRSRSCRRGRDAMRGCWRILHGLCRRILHARDVHAVVVRVVRVPRVDLRCWGRLGSLGSNAVVVGHFFLHVFLRDVRLIWILKRSAGEVATGLWGRRVLRFRRGRRLCCTGARHRPHREAGRG